MGDVTPLTDAERDALVDAAGKARGGLPCFNPAWPEFLTLANPAAILSWSARDAAQMRRIAELEMQLATARASALREAAAVIRQRREDFACMTDRDGLPARTSHARDALGDAAERILALIHTKGPTDAE